MKIIAGLGNPGLQYAKTKHNVGFMLLDALAQHLGASPWKEAFTTHIREVRIVGEKIFMVKPPTYMNESRCHWPHAGVLQNRTGGSRRCT